MLITELQELEEVKNLVAKGQTEAVIAYGEVAQALAEVDVDEGDVEELYGYLEVRASRWSTTSIPPRRPRLRPSARARSAASAGRRRRST